MMEILFAPSALKHRGMTKEKIAHALKTRKWEKPLPQAGLDTSLVVGYDHAANPIEIVVRGLDDDTLFVFHAMKARKKILEEAGL